ncbi:winged helix-turn-helix transcriptional regulator [Candidatus Woesearchaeota archaeon]|nr:winged helix-turn-helix transcriptional regulator [Candidatus Woesearchaeota archaeon]
MPDEPFLLVSLKEEKAKKLTQVLSNPTATKILDFLTKKEATETEISKKLKMPLSTVHYNLQQLTDAKLVVVEEFHYSPKGKEVNHYKLANKYIIIAPQEDKEGLLDRLKNFIPVFVLTFGMAVVLKSMQFFTGTTSQKLAAVPYAEIAEESVKVAADAVDDMAFNAVAESGGVALMRMAAEETANNTVQAVVVNETVRPVIEPVIIQTIPWWQSQVVDWLILGAFVVLGLFILVEIIRWLRKR